MSDHRRPIDEGALLDVAGALLYVEASLDDHIERLGAGVENETSEGELELPKAEVRKILSSYARPAPEGSPEWEILYQKTRQEVFRRRFRLA